VVPGDRVSVQGRIRPPPDDEYGDYLAKIGAIGTVRADVLELLPPTGSMERTLEGVRRAAADGLDRSMPEPESGLAAGILIGLRDRVDRDLADAFTVAGASHVVAISGWNIAIVASTLGALAGGLRRRRRAVLTAAAIVVYVAFVGPSPSVVRAAVMAGVALLARELGRPGTAAAALGWAVSALLLLDPDWAFDAGFRLSVLATAGIVAWGSGLTERLAGPKASRPRRWVADILGVSFAAQAATTPVVLSMFGRLSLVAPAVNLLVVPLVPPAMATGAVALVVGMLAGAGIPPVVATVLGLPAWVLYAAMVSVVRIGAGVPLASLELVAPWDGVAGFVSVVLILAVARWGDAGLGAVRRRGARPGAAAGNDPGRSAAGNAAGRSAVAKPAARSRAARAHPQRLLRLTGGAMVASTLGLSLVLVHRPDGTARVTALDVGQGDAILVEGGRGGRMVVDGGPDPGRLLLALDERLPPWDRRIDIVVLTHPHEDHVAGLVPDRQRYRVGRVYQPGPPGSSPGFHAWEADLADGEPPSTVLRTGDRLRLDDIRLRVLWPDPGALPDGVGKDGKAINNESVVLLGEVDGRRFLLMGDLEEDVDPTLVARGLPRLDLLKVAHHGSRTASSEPFLAATRPTIAVISVGADNDYGHPAPETLERLGAVGTTTYRTDLDGTIQVALTRDAVAVRTSRARQPVRAGFGPDLVVGDAIQAAPDRAAEGPRSAPAYHRGNGPGPQLGDRDRPRQRSPRLLLGRRRVWPRGGRGDVPTGRGALPRRPAGALAARGATRVRPPPGRHPGAARHRIDVRRRQPRDRLGRRCAGPEHGRPGGARRDPRHRRARQRAGDRRRDRVGRSGGPEQDGRRGDPQRRRDRRRAQGAQRRGPGGMDRAPGAGARDPAGKRGRSRARDARRRVHP
jgi:competence protein ComEC